MCNKNQCTFMSLFTLLFFCLALSFFVAWLGWGLLTCECSDFHFTADFIERYDEDDEEQAEDEDEVR